METPWMLPVITLCYFVVLLLTHVPHPPISQLMGKLAKRSTYREVEEQSSDPKESHPLNETPPHFSNGTKRSQPHHVTVFEDRRSGYLSDDMDMHETAGSGGFQYIQRASYMSAGSANMRGDDDFDDVVDYQQIRGHRTTGAEDWERRS